MDKDETLRLIRIYRKNDLIWDPKHPDHYNKLKKEKAWLDISEAMGRPIEQCKKKMEYLLSALRREKMKMTKTGESKEVYRSSWFAFESLRFIWDKNQRNDSVIQVKVEPDDDIPTEIQAKVEPENNIPAEMFKEDEENYIFMEPLQQEDPQSTPNTSFSEKRCLETPTHTIIKRRNFDEQSLDDTQANLLNDDSYHFGNFVAAKLRGYDESTRCTIQNEIMSIITRAAKGYYNES